MAKSILLLIERKNGGRGPEIPIRHEVFTVASEGVHAEDYVLVHVQRPTGVLSVHRMNGGMLVFEPSIEPGSYLRAELCGNNSVATVWVE